MSIAVNEKILLNITDTKSFYLEMKSVLNEIIDEEIMKNEDEIDCDLISDCINTIMEIEKINDDNYGIVVPHLSSKALLKATGNISAKHIGRGTRALVAACITLLFAISANAAVEQVFDYNIAHEIISALQKKSNGNKQESTNFDNHVSENVTKPDNDVDTEDNEDGNMQVSQVHYINDDNTEETKTVLTDNKNEVESKPDNTAFDNDKAPKPADKLVIIGVQGNPPDKLVYTQDDTSIDLTGLKLRFEYSNGTYSKWFYQNDVRIMQNIDFSKSGEQEIVLRINEEYDYKYSIYLNIKTAPTKPENNENNIASVKLGYVTYNYFQFYVNEEPDLRYLYITVTYDDGKSAKLYYADTDEMKVIGINNSIETYGSTKQFSIIYKGFVISADYRVANRANDVYKVTIIDSHPHGSTEAVTPKFLYYRGEELGVGKGIDSKTVIPELKSYAPFESDVAPVDWYAVKHDGFRIMAKNTSSNAYIYYNSDELDIYGYDPYKLGFQTLDVYYNGMYLTSYNVFVYGDDGYCPATAVNAFVDYADEKQLTVGEWYRCIGDGKLQTKEEYLTEILPMYDNKKYKAIHDPVYEMMDRNTPVILDDSTLAGWQNAKISLSDEYLFDLRIAQIYTIQYYKIIYDEKDYFELNMRELEQPDFGKAEVLLKIKKGDEIIIPLNEIPVVPRIIIDGKSYGARIDSSLDLKSAFIVYQLMLDRTKYKFNATLPMCVDAFVYEDGYESSISFEVIAHSDNVVCTNEDNLLNSYDYKLVANDNYLKVYYLLGYDVNKIFVKNVDFNQAGEQDAIIYTTYNGKLYEKEVHFTIKK